MNEKKKRDGEGTYKIIVKVFNFTINIHIVGITLYEGTLASVHIHHTF